MTSASFAMNPSDRSPVPAENKTLAFDHLMAELFGYMPILKYSLSLRLRSNTARHISGTQRLQWSGLT